MSQVDYQQIPEHVRRIIARDGEIEFTPPSFERWLGRLQMLRTLAAMGAFLLVWLMSYLSGEAWEGATIRGIAASLVFFYFSWAVGLFIFGEFYGAELRAARIDLDQKERDRARRIEEYYRERLRAQAENAEGSTLPASNAPTPNRYAAPLAAGPDSLTTPMPSVGDTTPDYLRRAA